VSYQCGGERHIQQEHDDVGKSLHAR
jgi:hypothetical protein